MRTDNDREPNIWKGAAAGIVGGLVASWTMEVFQQFWSDTATARQKAREEQQPDGQQPSEGQNSEPQNSEPGKGQEQPAGQTPEDPTTVKAAAAFSRVLFHHELAESEKPVAGSIAHYSMGVFSGGVYGISVERLPVAKAGAGLPFGAAVWAVADNIVLPVLGLAKPMTAYPVSIHAYALASHLVYGLTTEIVRRVLRPTL